MAIFRGSGAPGSGSSLSPTDGNFIVGNGTTWVTESGATARTSIGLGTTDDVTFNSLTTSAAVIAGTTLSVGTNLTVTGTSVLTGAVTANTFASSGATITGGTITGITDLAIADGGTAASTAAAARTNLDLYSTTETDNQAIAYAIALG